MLSDLSIRNILLIETLDLSFEPGLNVLTGETGAGKSILLDALGFVLGWRGRADVVRQGASEGEVLAEFELPVGHAAHAILSAADIPIDDTLILRRITGVDGRKRAFVNDRRCSGEVLRALSDTLVELHGQHDDRGLLDAKAHRGLLDAFAENDASRESTRQAWRDWSSARKKLDQARQTLEIANRDADFLRHSVAELDAFDPQAGEDEALDTRRRLMQMAGRIREDIAKAEQAMGYEGAEGRLGDALRWLETVSDKAEGTLEEPIAALGRALVELADAQRGVEDALGVMDHDPLELEQAEERLFALRALARKHNVQSDELPDLASDLRARLAAIDTGAAAIEDLSRQVKQTRATYETAAARLGGLRQAAATRLDAAMAGELAPLKLERAVFMTEISQCPLDEAGPEGRDSVAFTVATNPGSPAGPINRIASGGELSRFLLALKVCLTRRANDLTLIFDEIDRGVGGATADAVGRRLASVAVASQVLVVTHSPQVAALGAHHWRVSKSVEGDVTRTDVVRLDTKARVDEIARMLAGDVVTHEARAAAKALLSG